MVIVLIGIISVIAAMIIYQGAKSFGTQDVRGDLMEEGALALERVSKEVRLIRCTTAGNSCTPAASDITNMVATELRFVNTDYAGRGFRSNAGNLLLRQGSTGADPEDILSGNLSALTFDYLKKDGTAAAAVSDVWVIGVTLTLTKGAESINFKTSIHPRAFR